MKNIYQLPDSLPNIFDVGVDADFEQDDSLQGTNKWFKNRLGRFTGSKIFELMSCTRSSQSYEWGRPEKTLDFGETAKKYVYSKAKERQREKVLIRSIGINGDYGHNAEKIVKELLKKQFPDYKFEETEFIEFIKGIAGASPDGLVNYEMALEIKAAMDYGTLYTRFETVFDQKHKDFWQVQSEMLALNVKKCMYVVAEPPKNIYEPEITDLSIKYINRSEIHQKAIKDRCMIGNKAIELYLSGVNFHEAILNSCSNYEFK